MREREKLSLPPLDSDQCSSFMSELSPLTQMTHPLNDLPLQVTGVFVRLWTAPDPCRPQQDIHIRMENISPPAPTYLHNWESESWLGKRGTEEM